MTWQDFFVAIGLLFVFEGMFPFLSPERWRNYVKLIIKQDDRSLRIMGLVLMIVGLIIVTIMHFVLRG